jgi:hypothetical protein
MNSDAALSPVRVSEVVVDAPLTISITDFPSQAPAIKPTNEKALTIKPRRQPEIRMNAPNATKIMSR